MIAAWYGGIGPGLLTTGIGTFASAYFLVYNAGSTATTPVADLLRVWIVLVTGAVISVLCGALHRSHRQMEKLAENERRRAADLAAEQQKLQAVVQNMPAAMALAAPDGRIILENRLVAETLGHSLIGVGGVESYAILGGLDQDGRRLEPDEYPLARALRGENVIGTEYRYIKPDGSEIWVRAAAGAFRNDAGAIGGAVLLFRSIDKEKETEATLKAAESRLQYALAAGRLGAWHLNLSTGHMTCTRQCKANFGLPADAAFNYELLMELIVPDDRPAVRAAVQRAVEHHEEYVAEYRVLWPDGSLHWIGARGHAMYAPDGRAVSMDGVTADVTERKELEQVRREQAEALVDADQKKDQFLATLSHELRNPLAAILSAAQLLEVAGDREETRDRARTVIERQALHVTRLVNDLLEISRIKQGKMTLDIDSVDLNEVVVSAADTVRAQIDQRDQKLELETASAPLTVKGDAARLTQVMVNLLSNASKYTDGGGRIRLSTQTDQQSAIIRVADNGIGIPSHMLRRVFDPMIQVEDHRRRSDGGLGLGLALVQSLVQLHGGSVAAHSDGPGHGSEFVVRLPIGNL